MDRNIDKHRGVALQDTVVPRKGDVDRNGTTTAGAGTTTSSSPARGTWIEMSLDADQLPGIQVSSPARGTWIEIGRLNC